MCVRVCVCVLRPFNSEVIRRRVRHPNLLSLAKDVKLGKYTVPTGNRTPGRRVAVHYATATPRKLHYIHTYKIRINVSTSALKSDLSTFPESNYTIRVHQYRLIERLTIHVLYVTLATLKKWYGLYGLYVARLRQWSDINAFYSAATLEWHSDSAAVVLSKSDTTQPRYNPDKPLTEPTICGIAQL